MKSMHSRLQWGRVRLAGVGIVATTAAVIGLAAPSLATHGGATHTPVNNPALGNCTLQGPDKAPSGLGTLITIGLDCSNVRARSTQDFGFGTAADQGPLFEIEATAPDGTMVARLTDRFLNDSTGTTDTRKFLKEIFLLTLIDKVCVTVAGEEVCTPDA